MEGNKFNFNHDIKLKRFIYQTSESSLQKINWNKKNKVYWGIDPTGSSLHLGHLINIQLLIELLELGWDVVILLGNFTACIGDPTDKQATRSVIEDKDVNFNKEKLYFYIKSIFDKQPNKQQVSYVYNGDWLNHLRAGELLQYTYSFSVNHLINCDTFKQRLEHQSHLSLSEMLYTVLQAIDFKYLHDQQGVNIQLGGRDQWGNISNGVSFLKKHVPAEKKSNIFGLVTDLLEIDGKKVGKTTGHNLNISLNPLELFNNIYHLNDELIKQLSYLFLYKQLGQDHCNNRLDIIKHIFNMVNYDFNRVHKVFFDIQQGKHREPHKTYSKTQKTADIIVDILGISKAESKRYIKNSITLQKIEFNEHQDPIIITSKTTQNYELNQGFYYIIYSKKQLPIIVKIL